MVKLEIKCGDEPPWVRIPPSPPEKSRLPSKTPGSLFGAEHPRCGLAQGTLPRRFVPPRDGHRQRLYYINLYTHRGHRQRVHETSDELIAMREYDSLFYLIIDRRHLIIGLEKGQ